MGGRVAAIALVPGSRTAFYVGYATGGIFKLREDTGEDVTLTITDVSGLVIRELQADEKPASPPSRRGYSIRAGSCRPASTRSP